MLRTVVFLRSRPFFGAQLVMLPLLHQLKQWLPDHALRVVARDPVGPLYEQLPWVDEFVQMRGPGHAYDAARGASTLVCLHPSSEAQAAIAGLTRAPVRLGYRHRRLLDGVWTHAIDYTSEEYRALHCLRLLGAWRPLDPASAARAAMTELAGGAAKEAAAPGLHVVCMPGGSEAVKKWGLGNFLALADALRADYPDARVSVLIGPGERAEEATLRADPRPGVEICRQPSLPALAALVTRASLVVANDCGPSHVAHCAGVPLLTLFDRPKPEWCWPRPTATCLVAEAGSPLYELPVARALQACRRLLGRS